MSWRNDSTATNLSLLSNWVYGALRPVVRILRAAGVSEANLLESVRRACAQHDGEAKTGRLGSGSRYESLLALGDVIGAWSRSAAWSDELGHARDLSLRADDAKGFAALVRSVDPELHATAVLAELQRMDVVRVLPNATSVRLLRHAVRNASEDTFSVEPVLRDLQRFAETLEHQVFRDPRAESARLQLTVARLSIDPAKFDDFCRFVTRNGQVLLDSADDRLNSYQDMPAGGANYGVGVFVFFEDAPSSQADRKARQRPAAPG